MPRSIVIRTLFENGEGQAVDGRGMFGLSYDVERSGFAGCSSIHVHTRFYSHLHNIFLCQHRFLIMSFLPVRFWKTKNFF